jgi:hypothetical protein
LYPKFYSPIYFLDVESSSNYAKKLKLTGIATTTLDIEVSFKILRLEIPKLVPIFHYPACFQ